MAETASRDELFAALEEAPRKERFPLPSGKVVWIEEMCFLDWLRWQMDIAEHAPEDPKDGADEYAMARLAVRCVTNGAGTPILSPKDAERFAKGRGQIAVKLIKLCREVNGLDEASIEAAKKNSGAPPGSPSSTASPETAAT